MWEVCTLGEMHFMVVCLEYPFRLGSFPYPCVSSAELLSYLRNGNRLKCPENCSSELYASLVF